MTSPLGVKTKTSLALISNRRESRNSAGSLVSCCQSTRLRSQPMSPPSAVPPRAMSLYFQWAATPYSARRCISWVRIWISTGLPPGPITVVCSDWYMLNLGMAM
jgi:hypothetical protein